MLSSLLHSRSFRRDRQRDHSPFSSPFTRTSSPLATRRGEISERRRPAARYNDDLSGGEEYEEEEEEVSDANILQENLEEDLEDLEDVDSDGLGDATPLLPIFSAAHLGTY